MGGTGSGRRAMSDSEKRKKGTFRESTSEAARNATAAEKVVSGPWLSKIPEPDLPLNEAGRAKYNEVAKALFDQNKLTMTTCMDCEMLALHWQNVRKRIEDGKQPSADALKQISSITAKLKIAEDAPTIANPNEKKRFSNSGFSNRRSSAVRLRGHS